MDEVVALLTIETDIGSHVDIPFVVGAELSEDEFLTVCEVAIQRLAVVAEQSFFFRDHPKASLFVFKQGVDRMEIGEDTTKLTSRLWVGNLYHTEA